MSPFRAIRVRIFAASQAEFARIAGVTQSSISRWEKGASPSMAEMARIRDAARDRGIEWNDSWFFEIPPDAAAAPETAR